MASDPRFEEVFKTVLRNHMEKIQSIKDQIDQIAKETENIQEKRRKAMRRRKREARSHH